MLGTIGLRVARGCLPSFMGSVAGFVFSILALFVLVNLHAFDLLQVYFFLPLGKKNLYLLTDLLWSVFFPVVSLEYVNVFSLVSFHFL